MAGPRTFRVFVSSTFADLHVEREALQTLVFPRLRELCAREGARFQEVDLRWGISPEAGEDQQTLAICLNEIERCQRLTPRPNFIALTSERYGWRPIPPDIPLDDFDALQGAMEGIQERQLVAEWYHRDDNARPPRYLLRSRREALHSPTVEWVKVESQLAHLLRRAVNRLAWPRERAAPYVTSVTEREIELGALAVPDARSGVLAVRRRIVGLPQDRSAALYSDALGDGSVDPEAVALRDDLDLRLRSHLGRNMRTLVTPWAGGALATDHIGTLPDNVDDCLPLLRSSREPKTLCEIVWRFLGRLILAECAEEKERPTLGIERDAHAAFGDRWAAVVVGRDTELAAISAYLNGSDPRPLAVLGAFGSGKSALMARAAVTAGRLSPPPGGPQTTVVARFVGVTASSTSGIRLVGSLGSEIGAAFGNEVAPPTDARDLAAWFNGQISRASTGHSLAIFIDALDQLDAEDPARTLSWLPYDLPPGVRMVVSSAPGDVTDVLEGRQSESTVLRVRPLPITSAAETLSVWLDDVGRTLRPEQREGVLNSFALTGLPLHLRLAFEEARRWHSFDDPDSKHLANDAPGMVRQRFGRLALESEHGQVLVANALGYLSAARSGLTEDELLDVLSADQQVAADFARRFPHSPPVDRLPPIIWSRLYDDLEPYLTFRDADGAVILGFFHGQLADVARADYLGDGTRAGRHSRLADYFGSLLPVFGPERRPNLRRLSELPWHLAHSGRLDEFVATVANLGFLDARLRAAGPHALVDDLDLALESPARQALPTPSVEALSTIRAFVRLTSHILGRDPSQLASQLLGRIDPQGNDIVERLRSEAASFDPGVRSIRPMDRTLVASGGDLVATLAGHQDRVHGVGLTPDGRVGLSVSADGTLRVWNLDTQAERFIIPVGGGPVLSVAATPDGSQVVTGSDDGSIDVWDVASGAHLRHWTGEGPCRTLVFVPDGTRLASGTNGPGVLWRFETATPIARIDPASRATTAIAISADGGRAVVGGIYDYVTLLDLEAGRQVATLPQGRDSWVSAVAITPDGRYAYSSDWEGGIKVWDFDTATQVGKLVGHGYNRVTALALTAIGDVLTADDVDSLLLHSWPPDPGLAGSGHEGVILKVINTRGHRVVQISVTPDGRRAITAGGDGTLRVWDVSRPPDPIEPRTRWGARQLDDEAYDRQHRETWRGVLHTSAGLQAAAPPAFDVLQIGARSVIAEAWHVRPTNFDGKGDRFGVAYEVVDNAHTLRSPRIRTGRLALEPCLSPDGARLAVATREGELVIYEVATGMPSYSYRFAPAAVRPRWLAFSPDGFSVLCAVSDRVEVHRPASGAAPAHAEGMFDWTAYAGDFQMVAPRFTPDGDHLLAVTAAYVGLWRVGTPEPVVSWKLPPGAVVGLAADGARAWWATRDGRLRHWTIGPPGSRSRPVVFHLPTAIARVSVDGRFVVALDDSGLRIWRLPAARPVVQLAAPDTESVAVAFNELGGRRVSGLLAVGGIRLTVHDLASLSPIAAFDADAAVVRCRFSDPTELNMSTADGRSHRLLLTQ